MDIIARNNERNLVINRMVADGCINTTMAPTKTCLIEDQMLGTEITATNDHSSHGTPIQEFYSGSNVFITGGTGFMGKMLIDKLLRTCSSVENVYLLIRPKKGKDIHTRVEEMFDDPVFDRLRDTVPKFRHKIVALAGDCQLAGLGLKLTDRQTLINSIDVVFHAAATVRFDEKLKLAIDINVHGTKDVLELAKQMTKLRAIIHISTAYSNCHLRHIDEKFYDYSVGFEELDEIIDKLDDDAIDEITPKILGKWPNTYAFTKALAEDLIGKNCSTLPIGIFRPAIVTSTSKEPVVGWIDNLYGPTGVVAGVGTGVLRTMHCDKDINANIVPVDMTVNALITCAWDIASRYGKYSNMISDSSRHNPLRIKGSSVKENCKIVAKSQNYFSNKNFTDCNENQDGDDNNNNYLNVDDTQQSPAETVPIYNYVSSVQNPLTWGEFTELNIKHGFEFPFSSAIWYLTFYMHKSSAMNKLYIMFLHYIPALVIDTLAFCFGQKPRLIKVYKKIHKFSNVISFFCTNEWTFTNRNVQQLWHKLDEKDQQLFHFNMSDMVWVDYLRYYIKGMRIHLFKDDLSTVQAARKKWNRFYWLHQCLKLVLSLILLYTLWCIYRAIF